MHQKTRIFFLSASLSLFFSHNTFADYATREETLKKNPMYADDMLYDVSEHEVLKNFVKELSQKDTLTSADWNRMFDLRSPHCDLATPIKEFGTMTPDTKKAKADASKQRLKQIYTSLTQDPIHPFMLNANFLCEGLCYLIYSGQAPDQFVKGIQAQNTASNTEFQNTLAPKTEDWDKLLGSLPPVLRAYVLTEVLHPKFPHGTDDEKRRTLEAIKGMIKSDDDEIKKAEPYVKNPDLIKQDTLKRKQQIIDGQKRMLTDPNNAPLVDKNKLSQLEKDKDKDIVTAEERVQNLIVIDNYKQRLAKFRDQKAQHQLYYLIYTDKAPASAKDIATKEQSATDDLLNKENADRRRADQEVGAHGSKWHPGHLTPEKAEQRKRLVTEWNAKHPDDILPLEPPKPQKNG